MFVAIKKTFEKTALPRNDATRGRNNLPPLSARRAEVDHVHVLRAMDATGFSPFRPSIDPPLPGSRRRRRIDRSSSFFSFFSVKRGRFEDCRRADNISCTCNYLCNI